ncbi:NADP-dependent 3-hydroxy acid dehydrogenase YdfG [Povalibacter uvarum]|uniref:NADP-dependent 3-hydroxy acid dehydrogenase YdfG n=1 Tax=Povalibacter uvarum TaxID=732238 RepID=A0A841HMA0_9GAMM|nr:SDR family oxidoreductase [Povalibacter uvarum]MBB6093873.1 NADP-dependent 3-hydroxy acid dehydrogenase YdfG [Povalibacter uvarum]
MSNININAANSAVNRVVLITGASSGIGEATARVLADNGAIVVLGARRTERLAKIASEIRAHGGIAEYRSLDVTSKEDVKAFVAFTKEKFGRIDVMFNNAGVMPVSPMNALKTDEWDRIVDVNIKGVLNGIAAALPVMEAQGSGHIINTASTGAHAVGAQFGVYCASKYAVRAITEGLRQEMDTIRVTLLSPGVTESELGSDITVESTATSVKQLRSVALSADAIARAVLYAISQPADVDVSEMIIRSVRSAGHAF